ncbi:hypothetical protein [Marinobacter sp. P4B1]|uniref:hypothetical protein n=1 Tax=Marinobacter sp. P4B1 TaxID=1119533 RepID=UPI00071CFF14|nr:hypothetical protein [Marinobacter sp. P4B1]KRW83624.1 hypothetical protein AQ621_16380 [Marinobacter sp. P4B1]
MSTNNLQSYTDNAFYFVIPEPVLDLAARLKLSYSETMVYVLHFNMGYRWKTWISTLTCRKIADRLKISERAVSMAHRKLSDLGLIKREKGVRYNQYREAPAATTILLSPELEQSFKDAPTRSSPNSTDVYAHEQQKGKASQPLEGHQHQVVDSSSELAPHKPEPVKTASTPVATSPETANLSDLPPDIRAAIDLKRGRYSIEQMLRAKQAYSEASINKILSIYDRKHGATSTTKLAPDPSLRGTASKAREGFRTPDPVERLNSAMLFEEIEKKLHWSVKGRMHDIRPGIAEEIAFALTLGTLRDKSFNHGLNIALKLVREERWTAPKGFHLYEAQLACRA